MELAAMKRTLTSLGLWAVCGLTVLCSCDRAAIARDQEKPNILLILVDDLKPALGCYGDLVPKTPNLDRLVGRGLRFDLAYCNQAVCAPSRFTLMLGSHSTSTGLYGLGSQLRQLVPDAVTLPHYFARHGYRTESLGKVLHIGHGNHGDPDSFQVPHFHDVFEQDGTAYRPRETRLLCQLATMPSSRPRQPPQVATPADRQQLRDGIAAHDHALFVKAGWIRDPYIVSAPDGYFYLTGTTPLPDDPRQKTDPYNTGLGSLSIVGWKARSRAVATWWIGNRWERPSRCRTASGTR